MIENIIIYLLIIFWVYTQAVIDFEHFKNNQFFKDHSSRLLSRASVGAIIFMLNPIIGLQIGLIFWSLFDFILNKLRRFAWDYQGSEANTDKINKDVWIASKFTTLILSLLLLIF